MDDVSDCKLYTPPPHTHTECQNGKITLGERKRIVGREWIMKSATS